MHRPEPAPPNAIPGGAGCCAHGITGYAAASSALPARYMQELRSLAVS